MKINIYSFSDKNFIISFEIFAIDLISFFLFNYYINIKNLFYL
jgi:hypothetical protein